MRPILIIAWRDIRAFFYQPLAFVLLTGYIFLSSLVFHASLSNYMINQQNPRMLEKMSLHSSIVEPLYSSMSILLLIMVPLITMRLMAEEFRQRTDELWMTSPVRTIQIILGKYLAATGFFTIMIALSIIYPLILSRFGEPDMARVWLNVSGLWLTMACLVAAGLFVSALTENVVVAAVGGFAVNMAFWILISFGDASWYGQLAAYAALPSHFYSITRGLVDTRDLVYFGSYIFFFLFLANLALESKSWR